MLLFAEKTETIIKCFYKVYNELGYGFLEKVYENAMIIELNNAGFHCHQQCPVDVHYGGTKVGIYFPDILVDNTVILELKAGDGGILREHELQLMNFLKATELNVGLISYFGTKPTFKRKLFTINNLPPG